MATSSSFTKAPVSQQVRRRDFHVCVEGSPPVGPVSAEQIARGVVAGKVPRSAFVARAGDPMWTDLLDVPEIVAALSAI